MSREPEQTSSPEGAQVGVENPISLRGQGAARGKGEIWPQGLLTLNNDDSMKWSDSEFLIHLQTAFYLVCQLPPEKDGRVQFKTWDCIQRRLLRYDSRTEREVNEDMSHKKRYQAKCRILRSWKEKSKPD